MSAVVITLGGKSKTLETGESYTFRCAGQFLSMTNYLSIKFNSNGYFTYAGLTTLGNSGKVRRLLCAGKVMATDVVIVAGEHGGSPLPIEIPTEAKMDGLLTNATSQSVGAVYKYTGETTGVYEKDSLYIIEGVE